MLSAFWCLMQVQSLSQVNQRLQDSLHTTTKAHQAERAKRENLHKQVRKDLLGCSFSQDCKNIKMSRLKARQCPQGLQDIWQTMFSAVQCCRMCCAVLCCAVLCCTAPQCVLLCSAVPCCTVMRCVVLCCAVLCCTLPCLAICRAMLC